MCKRLCIMHVAFMQYNSSTCCICMKVNISSVHFPREMRTVMW